MDAFVHHLNLILIQKIIRFPFPSYKQHTMIPEQQVGLCRLPSFISPPHRLGLSGLPIFFPLLAFSQSFLALAVYLTVTGSLNPPTSMSTPPPLYSPTHPLAVMLMHSQSACPLRRRALHVHQAVQRPCMQMSSNCSGVQTPSNLLPGGERGVGGAVPG